MWSLNQIYAKNLCSFKELDYQLLQEHTTLVFGNNMDNDSQGSNGSGKSAMLEAIAIGLTGESLRKVKMDEIINDSEDHAVIALTLTNSYSNDTLYIRREFSRKSPQDISIIVTPFNEQPKKIIQAGVSDYNKYVLETIGLSKDEIYANFVLSKHKYSSFLASSDREKKEIINRFSNGIIVDESIAALQADMVPVEESLKEADTKIAVLNGKIDTLKEQIEIAISEQVDKSQKKAERIEAWKTAIAQKRELIRNLKNEIAEKNNALDKLDEIDAKIQDLEESNCTIKKCCDTIFNLFDGICEVDFPDYDKLSRHYQQELKEAEVRYNELLKDISAHKLEVEAKQESFRKLSEEYKEFELGYDKKSVSIQKDIDSLIEEIKNVESENSQLNKKRMVLNGEIAELHKLLAGVIVCPVCKHEFVIKNNVDIKGTKQKLTVCQSEVDELLEMMHQKAVYVESKTLEGRELRGKQNSLEQSKMDWSKRIQEANCKVNQVLTDGSIMNTQLDGIAQNIKSLKTSIESSRKNLFDSSFDLIDSSIKALENSLKQLELSIESANGAIQSYEESIEEAERSSENDLVENMKASKAKYETDLVEARSEKEEIERQFNSLKVQEATFVEFKTHLANSKIDALSHITNEFLEAIGSDIRISFSGFTVLKSGKIRDKISISLLRDGVDCGSYDKFSEGEKTRVNLASILAMHKLTNLNCVDGKGLDLLVLDEILEATDEQGLANIFDALNQLQITSLVVSHGSTAENYPYKTVVNKLNGVSFLNDGK